MNAVLINKDITAGIKIMALFLRTLGSLPRRGGCRCFDFDFDFNFNFTLNASGRTRLPFSSLSSSSSSSSSISSNREGASVDPLRVPRTSSVAFDGAVRLDYASIKSNVDEWRKTLAARGMRESVLDDLLRCRETWVDARRDMDALRSEKGRLSKDKTVPVEEKRARGGELKASLAAQKDVLDAAAEELRAKALFFPNTLHPECAVGNESMARVVGSNHDHTNIASSSADHLDIGARLRLFDFETTAMVTGSKFVTLTNELALLELAVAQMALTRLYREGFVLLNPPDLVKKDVLEACGFSPRGEATQVYSLDGPGDLCLVGTGEIPLAGALINARIGGEELNERGAVRMAGFTHCFRTEAGSMGRENKGLYRVHQFSKVEMFVACRPSESANELEKLRAFQESMCEDLGLAWRTLDMPSEELGCPAHRKYDVEVWMPSRNGYGEVASISNCTDFQSRRLNVMSKERGGETDFLHTLNGTACAIPRLLMAILETHASEDGATVRIPEPLHPFLGGITVLEARD